ncbi:LD-carboxypeptidase [soil metagenome]
MRLVSPASFPDPAGIADVTTVLESWGLQVQVGEHAQAQWGYMAGRDGERLADLNDAFRDPTVRAVVTTRGGAGAYRICEEIDFDAVRADPKPLIGFSDITYLQATLWRECRLPTIHGWLVGEDAIGSARALMMDGNPVMVSSEATAYSAQIRVAGVAEGPLLGGNLTSLSHLVGAGLPDLEGAILLLEDKRDMGLGRVDRQLTQLRRSGALDSLAGVALGLFSGFDGYTDRGWELVDVLEDHVRPLGVPVLGGLRIGHNGTGASGLPDQYCVALGARAVLDADRRVLRSESPAHLR